MAACDILLGAFYRSSPGYYDDVRLDTTDPPPTFTTGLNAEFPAAFLNDTQPSGYPAGTGGSDAINKQINLQIASVPQMDQPGNLQEVLGVNGNPLFLRRRNAPRGLSMGVNMPEMEMTAALYNQTWDALKHIAFRQVYCWFLHERFAFKGFIADGADLFRGERLEDNESLVLKIKYFYVATVSGSTKTYTLLTYD